LKTYLGWIDCQTNECCIHVVEDPDENEDARSLDLRLDVANHSPTGFAWGYAGSGPAQTALALLCDALGPGGETRALAWHHVFLWEKIARLEKNAGWEMSLEDVIGWLPSWVANDT
jgi:Family of unknown function (DUF6166)